ncbi:TonB-dependent receptor [Solimonas terrae]|uniref:TonB-dependent receptor n=2 Tax=Solimonas terrae TaxID=1396819 RepID=A0A6M2BUY5_9GAMM|nr:TonB-dependent receptor [Solimonas terrae]
MVPPAVAAQAPSTPEPAPGTSAARPAGVTEEKSGDQTELRDVSGEGESAEQPFGAEKDNSGIAEIVVTAQRRSESLQRVPVSVTALTADTLSSRNVNDLNQLALAAPTLQIGLLGNYSIRGVGTLALASTVDSSVATAVDEVNIGRPGFAVNLFNDVERVEVLNGPQGLLFGRNASAGLLNIVTARPVLGEFHNSFSTELASFDRPGDSTDGQSIIVRETINVPITETSALRLNGFSSQADSVTTLFGSSGERQDTDPRQWGTRAKYLNDFTDRLSVYLIGEYAESHGTPTNTYRSVGVGSTLIGPQLVADGITAAPDNFRGSSDGAIYRDLSNVGAQATIAYDLGGGVVLSDIAAWKRYKLVNRFDIDLTSADILNTNLTDTDFEQYSNEIRLTFPSASRLSGQVGLYYYYADTDSSLDTHGGYLVPEAARPNPPFCVGPGPTANCSQQNLYVIGRDFVYALNNESYAAFGQMTFDVTQSLRLIAGARVTYDDLSIIQSQNQNNYFRPLGVRATFDQSTNNTNLSWKAGTQYQITQDIMAYATVGSGYKGAGANDNGATVDANLIVKPETSDNVEVGMRSSLFDHRLIVNASVFHTKFKNYQSQSFDADLTAFVIQNAASLTSRGSEISIIAKPFRGFTLNGTVSLVDSKFDSFPGAQCYPGQTTEGCATSGSFDAAGFETPTTPRFTSSVQAIYERPISGTVSGFVQANYYHRSEINYQVNGAPGSEIGPIDILGASVGVDFGNGARVSLFCNNCTNEHYPAYVASDPIDATTNVATFNQTFSMDSVRKIGIAISLDF